MQDGASFQACLLSESRVALAEKMRICVYGVGRESGGTCAPTVHRVFRRSSHFIEGTLALCVFFLWVGWWEKGIYMGGGVVKSSFDLRLEVSPKKESQAGAPQRLEITPLPLVKE